MNPDFNLQGIDYIASVLNVSGANQNNEVLSKIKIKRSNGTVFNIEDIEIFRKRYSRVFLKTMGKLGCRGLWLYDVSFLF